MFHYDKFKKRFEQEATLRNLSDRTFKSYWWFVNDYGSFLNSDPETSGIEDLRLYFQTMLTDGNHKPGSVKIGCYALQFLFTNVYHKDWAQEYLSTPKIAQTLPLVLAKEEVADVLQRFSPTRFKTQLSSDSQVRSNEKEVASCELTTSFFGSTVP